MYTPFTRLKPYICDANMVFRASFILIHRKWFMTRFVYRVGRVSVDLFIYIVDILQWLGLNWGFAQSISSFSISPTSRTRRIWYRISKSLLCLPLKYLLWLLLLPLCWSTTTTWHGGKILCSAATASATGTRRLLHNNNCQENGVHFTPWVFFFAIILLATQNSTELNTWIFLSGNLTIHTLSGKSSSSHHHQERSCRCRQRGVFVHNNKTIGWLCCFVASCVVSCTSRWMALLVL